MVTTTNQSSSKDKINQVFSFLTEHHSHNHRVQANYYKSILTPYYSVPEKVISLLYTIMGTQSQPKLDFVGGFFQDIHGSENYSQLGSFRGFLQALNKGSKGSMTYLGLFDALNRKNGWGEKTSAFFTKAIYDLHCGDYDPVLNLWADATTGEVEGDRLYLPVDSVIINVFKLIDPKLNSFKKINEYLYNAGYTHKNFVIWDDLWFWGYFTQKGSGYDRVMGLNEYKYWAYPYFIKESDEVKCVMDKAKEFLRIIQE